MAHVKRKYHSMLTLYPIRDWEQFKIEIPKSQYVQSHDGIMLTEDEKRRIRSRYIQMEIITQCALVMTPKLVVERPDLFQDLLKYGEETIRYISNIYTAAPIILDVFGNKMAVCGGFLSSRGESNDLDFFFHSCTQDEAGIMMKESVSMIQEAHYGASSQKCTIELIRGEHATSVVVNRDSKIYHNWKITITYQFIQRVYPSLESVLAGFDLASSMVAWNGKDLLSTEQGAWCQVNNTIIVDIQRRSTTFSHRINKYWHRGYQVAFPGCDHSVMMGIAIYKDNSYDDFKRDLASLQYKYGIQLGSVYSGEMDYGGGSKLSSDDIWKMNVTQIFMDVQCVKNFKDGRRTRFIDENMMHIDGTSDYCIQDCDDKWCRNSVMYEKGLFESLISKVSVSKDSNVYELFENPHVILEDNLGSESSPITESSYDTVPLSNIVVLPEFGQVHPKIVVPEIRQPSPCFVTPTVHPMIKETDISKKVCRDAEDRLRIIKWISQDPGRQWSSTINPAIVTAQEFYNGNWNGLHVVVSEKVETILRLAQRCPENVWFKINKDVFRLIMIHIAFM
jgi:hypothetical protein